MLNTVADICLSGPGLIVWMVPDCISQFCLKKCGESGDVCWCMYLSLALSNRSYPFLVVRQMPTVFHRENARHLRYQQLYESPPHRVLFNEAGSTPTLLFSQSLPRNFSIANFVGHSNGRQICCTPVEVKDIHENIYKGSCFGKSVPHQPSPSS